MTTKTVRSDISKFFSVCSMFGAVLALEMFRIGFIAVHAVRYVATPDSYSIAQVAGAMGVMILITLVESIALANLPKPGGKCDKPNIPMDKQGD